jgi:hypothetical protein
MDDHGIYTEWVAAQARIAELEALLRLMLSEVRNGRSSLDRVCEICVFALEDRP